MATIGKQIDDLHKLKAKKKEAEAQVKTIAAQIEENEGLLLAELDKQGISASKGKLASVSVNETEVPQVIDWDVFHDFVIKKKKPYLLERRPATVAWRELKEQGLLVPGTVPFKKRSLNMRSIKE